MLKWQIDKSIVNDNKKQLTSEVHGLIFIPSFATVNEKKKKSSDVFAFGKLQHAIPTIARRICQYSDK